MAASKQASDEVAGDNLIEEVRRLRVEAYAVLEQAKQDKQLHTVLLAIDKTAKLLELEAKLFGIIQEKTVTVNILQLAEWNLVQGAIMKGLEGHPEARLQVHNALLEVQHAD